MPGAAILTLLSAALLPAASPDSHVDFGRDILPVFREHCVECHGPSQQMRGLRLDRRRDALPNRVGANGARIVPGNSAKSALFQRISSTKPGTQMPPSGPLPEAKIKLLQVWIDQGAVWPDELSGDRSTTPPDPVVEKMRAALREGRQAEFKRLLRANPQAVHAKGQEGWTALMYAAVYGSAQDLTLLLDAGAPVNARNEAGATALMYAIDDLARTKVLLDRGADPNLRSGEGRTALLIAASNPGGHAIAKALLDKGADAKAKLPNGRGILPLASSSGDPQIIRLLLDRGVTSPASLNAAIAMECKECLDLLLPHAQPQDLNGALVAAAVSGNVPLLQSLLERGAQSPPPILQMAALSSQPIPAPVIQTLIARGADTKLRTSFGLSTVEFAQRQGNEALVRALLDAGLTNDTPTPADPRPKPAASARAAIERALPPLQRCDVAFLERAGCVSCHNNSLTAMSVAAARPRGFKVDEKIASSQLKRIASFLEQNSERAHENEGIPGGIDTVSYILLGMAAEKYPADGITDAWARYAKNTQSPDGRFKCRTNRPPLESSDFQVTAATIRSLLAYAPKSRQAEYRQAVSRAVAWMEKSEPATTEDHVYRILGLVWGNGSGDVIRTTASRLLALQRQDGGWGQTPKLSSDAYATGQALVALQQARMLAPKDPAYQRGVQFLLLTQMEDGSWLVRTRAPSFQPYFDSDFPHQYDQFISAAASNWAVMALLPASPRSRP